MRHGSVVAAGGLLLLAACMPNENQPDAGASVVPDTAAGGAAEEQKAAVEPVPGPATQSVSESVSMPMPEHAAAAMHPSWDRDGDGLNDCEFEDSCDHTIDYSQPRPASSSEAVFYIGHQRRACHGLVPMQCLMVKRQLDAEWENFYGAIEGFNWQPGYSYKLKLALEPIANPPADGSSIRYRLLEVLEKQAQP